MLGDEGLGGPERVDQLMDAARAGGELGHDADAQRRSECFEQLTGGFVTVGTGHVSNDNRCQ
jgi:hypothetical protein